MQQDWIAMPRCG